VVRTFAFLISCYTSYDNTLQTLQHAATRCNTLQHTATHCITLHHTASTATHATHCNNAVQHTAVLCNTLQYTAARFSCKTHVLYPATNLCYTTYSTEWQTQLVALIIQVIFRKQAINYWSYLREMTLIMHDKGEES